MTPTPPKWPAEQTLNNAQLEINYSLQRFDAVARSYECVWGCGTLQNMVSPDTRAKWARHMENLNTAIKAEDAPQVALLVEGAVRGWGVLQTEAQAMGYKPNAPDVWDFRHPESGRRYRICKNLPDAAAATVKGVIVYSPEEIARILESQQLVNVVKEEFPAAVVSKAYGMAELEADEIPW